MRQQALVYQTHNQSVLSNQSSQFYFEHLGQAYRHSSGVQWKLTKCIALPSTRLQYKLVADWATKLTQERKKLLKGHNNTIPLCAPVSTCRGGNRNGKALVIRYDLKQSEGDCQQDMVRTFVTRTFQQCYTSPGLTHGDGNRHSPHDDRACHCPGKRWDTQSRNYTWHRQCQKHCAVI